MNKKEKKTIIGMVVIFAIIIIVLLVVRVNSQKKEEVPTTTNPVSNEKYVDLKEDGTKVNKSNKLKETKKLGDLEISNIQLTSKDNESYLEATVKNTGSAKLGDDFITITVVDDKGETITSIMGYLSTVEPGKQVILSSKCSSDFANAYDFTVSK